MSEGMLVTIDAAPASDSWGFVGQVLVGEHEAYRTIRAYPTPTEALEATRVLVAGVLGSLLAGQEWRSTQEELGHAPRRTELQMGLGSHARSGPSGDADQRRLPG